MKEKIMGNYSGETSFEFEIERYKHKETGEYYPIVVDQGTKYTHSAEDIGAMFEYVTLLLKIEGRSSYQDGKIYGLPEDSYPPEGETEIKSAVGPDGKDWQDKLSESEREDILEMIQNDVEDEADNFDYEGDGDDDGRDWDLAD